MEHKTFIDETIIKIKAGNGGNGIIAFHREKFVNKGGPSGGDGGSGGNIYGISTTELNTLVSFNYQKKYLAPNGKDGQAKMMTGKSGEDLIFKVPIGTQFYNEEGKLVADFVKNNQKILLQKGGIGGRGNVHFKSSKNPRSEICENGEQTEELTLNVILKILADVGFIGLPNVGKSTLLSKLTNAKPKIASYQFTTLIPQIGISYVNKTDSFVVADLPGLIQGAAEGKGLGLEFLKHIERCQIICHVIDISSSNPLDDYKIIRKELEEYHHNLENRKELIVINKIDLVIEEVIEEVIDHFINNLNSKNAIVSVSSLKEINLDKLKFKINDLLKEINSHYDEDEVKLEEYHLYQLEKKEAKTIEYLKVNQNTYWIKGEYIEYWLSRIPFNSYQNMKRFEQKLITKNVFKQLKKMGAKKSDTILIGKNKYEYILEY